MSYPNPTPFGPYLPDRRLVMPPMPVPIPIGRIADFPGYLGPSLIIPLQIQRGDSLRWVFRAYREVTGAPGAGCVDPDYPYGRGTGPQALTGLQGRAVIRRAKDHPQEWALAVAVDQTSGTPTSGQIIVTAPANETRLYPDHGVWDLELNDGTDVLRKTVAEGPVAFNRDTAI